MARFRMPAEWEPHLATYLVWPHNRDTWPGKFDLIPVAFAQMAAAIACFEPVRILINQESQAESVRTMIAAAPVPYGYTLSPDRIEFLTVPTNDSWIRDHGPIFVNAVDADKPAGGRQIALDWIFNSWGGKYGPSELDDAVPRRIGHIYSIEVLEPGIVLEGGAIDVNGAGALLTTESCLLNPNRNPALSREQIEEYLRVYLGVERIMWLGEGIAGDDTDGHVDDLARFVAPGTVVTVVEHNRRDVNYAPLRDNLRRLEAMRDKDGRPLHIETLPMPSPVFHEGVRLPASYANFYIVNGAVIMPSFACDADEAAGTTLARLFPQREIVAVPATDLVWGLGAVHCLTQQHPAP